MMYYTLLSTPILILLLDSSSFSLGRHFTKLWCKTAWNPVLADPYLLPQALSNQCENMVRYKKHTPTGWPCGAVIFFNPQIMTGISLEQFWLIWPKILLLGDLYLLLQGVFWEPGPWLDRYLKKLWDGISWREFYYSYELWHSFS